MIGTAITAARFYGYGKKHFTRTGWLKASANYNTSDLDVDLKGKNYVVTGANSGIGYEISKFLASKGGTVYMVCRNKERGDTALNALVSESNCKEEDVHLIVGDVSLASDVRRIAKEIQSKAQTPQGLTALVCNAGALLDNKTLTSEGMETTFACHLLNGSFLLSSLLMPLLKATDDSRVIMVASGGMLNSKFPGRDAVLGNSGRYNGQLAYAYAKRGQVLLAERWTEEKVHDPVKVITAHPGWCKTPGVTAAYGSSEKWLEPMRSMWEGAEGICWSCVVPRENLKGGAFYLDRSPTPKHLDGFLWGKRPTENSQKDIDQMMKTLHELAPLEAPSPATDNVIATDTQSATGTTPTTTSTSDAKLPSPAAATDTTTTSDATATPTTTTPQA